MANVSPIIKTAIFVFVIVVLIVGFSYNRDESNLWSD